MSPPIRIQLSRAKGWRMPPNTVKVDRTSRWGNPFPVEKAHPWKDQAWSVLQYGFWVGHLERFADYLDPPSITEIQAALRGKNLACWCKLGSPCHADLLLKLANTPAAQSED